MLTYLHKLWTRRAVRSEHCYSEVMVAKVCSFYGLLLIVSLAPLSVSAQSLEWVSEHPGSTSPALLQTTDTSLATTATLAASSTLPNSTPISIASINTNNELEARVRAYFSDAPIMPLIAQCESRFREFDVKGNPLNGGAGGMIGIFQINAPVHAAYAKSIGMDIYTVAGNLAYARKLYSEEGTGPWLDSFSCWHPLQTSTPVFTSTPSPTGLTRDLVLGVISPEVQILQALLNTHGYVLATAGPGSSGHETTKFGSLTRAGVRTFQCDTMHLCSGDEGTTGYGMVNMQTRTALLAFSSSVPMTPSATSSSQASPSSDTTITSNIDDSAKIAALQKQIADLVAQIFALKQKLGRS